MKTTPLKHLLKSAHGHLYLIEGVLYASARAAADHLQLTPDAIRKRTKSDNPKWTRWLRTKYPAIRYVYHKRIYRSIKALLQKERIGFKRYQQARQQEPYTCYLLTYNNQPLRTESEIRQYLMNDIRYPTQKLNVEPVKPHPRGTHCRVHGILYTSIKEAVTALNISPRTLLYRLKNQTPGYEYYYERQRYLTSPRVTFSVANRVYPTIASITKDIPITPSGIRNRFLSPNYPEYQFQVDNTHLTKSMAEVKQLLSTPVTPTPTV